MRLLEIFCFGILIGAIAVSFLHALWNPVWTDGDEVHYLVMTESLIKDRDLKLANNYNNGDYLDHHGVILPGGHGVISPVDGSYRSWHGILLPIIAVPGYFARDLIGARVWLWLITTVISILLMLKVFGLLEISKPAKYITVALFLVQMPVVLFSQYVYTDMLGGVIWLGVATCLLIFDRFKQNIWLLLASSLLGLGVHLNIKFILIGFIVILTWTFSQYKLWQKESWQLLGKALTQKVTPKALLSILPLLFLVLPFLVILGLHCFLMYRWFGSWNPIIAHELIFEKANTTVTGNPLQMFLTLLLDGTKGLFVNAPVTYLLIPALIFWFNLSKKTFLEIALPTLIFLIAHSLFNVWDSWDPPARYTMYILPTLTIGLGLLINKIGRTWWGILAICGMGIFGFLLTVSLYFMRTGGYPSQQPYNWYWEWIAVNIRGVPDIDSLYLDFQNPTILDYGAGLTIILMLLVIGWIMWVQVQSNVAKTSH